MHIGMIVDMAAEAGGDRPALSAADGTLSYQELIARVRRVAAFLAEQPGDRVAFLDTNSEAFPITYLAAAYCGKAFVPLNYRLTDDRLQAALERTAPAALVVGDQMAERVGQRAGIAPLSREQLLRIAGDPGAAELNAWEGDPEDAAVLLFTSGTTGPPKAAMLRNRHLTSYVMATVEFLGAEDGTTTLVSVPPYHIAGLSAVLSNLYGGRRIVYLESFDPADWVETVQRDQVTHAMVVPTMLGRILDHLEATQSNLDSLRALSYGGGPMPLPTIERALRLLPHVDFINAYGLTETSSTISVLSPEDHRAAIESSDPAVRQRLSSVGRPLPTVDISIRDPFGQPVPQGHRGEIWIRGEQVSGEYAEQDTRVDGGWFPTRDEGSLDADGFLYIHGRLDDVIVRGGENLSPGEIEAVLHEHPAVRDVAVWGLPDTEWGEKVVAAVVLEDDANVTVAELQDHARAHLRSIGTPELIEIRDELPYSETGKLLRRKLKDEFSTTSIG